MARVSCPFCNAAFDAPDAGPAACPRCGESLPGRGVAPLTTPSTATEPSRGPNWPVRIGVVVLVVGVVAGLVALRSFRDPLTPAPPPAAGAAVAAPAQLAGWKYLPPESNVVFAVQPAAIFRHATKVAGNPTEEMVKAGVPASVLAALGQGGVPLDAIDHVAAGAVIPDAGELRLGVALVLRQPLHDEAKFLDALKAQRPAAGNPPHYKVEFGMIPLKLVRLTDTTWLFGWTEADLAPVGTGLSDRMRDQLAQAVPPDAAACLLTDSADWGAKAPVNLLLTATGKADWQPGLAKVRAAAAALTLTDPPTLRVMAKGATPAARDELRAAFRRQPGTTGETGEWVYLDAPAERAGGLAALRAVLATPK